MNLGSLGEAFVAIRAKMDQLKGDLDEAQSTVQSRMDRVGEKMGASGKKMSRNLTMPLVGAGVAIAKTAGNFESGMNKVEAISGAAGDQLDEMRQQAKDLGSSTQYSASEAADAMSFLAMAGFEANEITGAMPGTLQLAAAGNMDLANAADIASNVLTGYGMKAEDLGHANDVLAKTFTSTNTDLSMLGESMKYAAPVAKSAGVAFEESAAAIGLMGNAGIQGSMAGTALRGAISKLLKPSDEAAGTMKKLGINATDSEGKLLPLEEIIRQLESSGADTADMMTIFGQRAGPAMSALVDQGADALGNLRGELESSGGTAEKIADAQMKGFNGAMKELKSALEGAAIALAESGLLDGLTSLAKKLASAFQWISSQPPAIQKLILGVAAFAAAIGPVLVIMAKLIQAFKIVKGAFIAVKVAMMANPFALLIGAIIGLTILIIANWDKIKEYLSAAWNWIKDTAARVWNALTSFFTDKVEETKAELTAAWDAIKGALSAAWDAIKDAATSVWNAIKAFFSSILDAIKGVFTAAWDGIKAAVTAVWDGMKAAAAAVFDAVKAYFERVLGNIKGIFQTVWDAIVGVIEVVWDTISGIFTDALSALKSLLSGEFDEFLGFFRDLPGRILKALGDIGSLLLGAGKDLIMGFVRGITGAFGKVKNKLGELTSKLTSWKGPPAKDRVLLRGAGEMVLGGFIDGIDKKTAALRSKLSDVTSAVENGVRPNLAAAMPGGGGVPGGGAGRSYTQQGPLLNIENLTVRDDGDIEELSRMLHNENRHTLRALGQEDA